MCSFCVGDVKQLNAINIHACLNIKTRERPAVLAAFILRGKKGDSCHIFSLIWPLMFFSHF